MCASGAFIDGFAGIAVPVLAVSRLDTYPLKRPKRRLSQRDLIITDGRRVSERGSAIQRGIPLRAFAAAWKNEKRSGLKAEELQMNPTSHGGAR